MLVTTNLYSQSLFNENWSLCSWNAHAFLKWRKCFINVPRHHATYLQIYGWFFWAHRKYGWNKFSWRWIWNNATFLKNWQQGVFVFIILSILIRTEISDLPNKSTGKRALLCLFSKMGKQNFRYPKILNINLQNYFELVHWKQRRKCK